MQFISRAPRVSVMYGWIKVVGVYSIMKSAYYTPFLVWSIDIGNTERSGLFQGG